LIISELQTGALNLNDEFGVLRRQLHRSGAFPIGSHPVLGFAELQGKQNSRQN
jgi:hypothetical protein